MWVFDGEYWVENADIYCLIDKCWCLMDVHVCWCLMEDVMLRFVTCVAV